MAEGRATYRIYDEGGKLDVNQAPVELLGPTLQGLGDGQGIDAFDAVTIARAIIGKNEGEIVTFQAPGGEKTFEIIEVKYV